MKHGNAENSRIAVLIPETDTKRVGNDRKCVSGERTDGNVDETLISKLETLFIIRLETRGWGRFQILVLRKNRERKEKILVFGFQ